MIAIARPEMPSARAEQVAPYFERVCILLQSAHGREWAMTIDEITEFARLPDRRTTEALMETHLDLFPWPLVAGADGYYIPTEAGELNRYVESLRGRAVKIFVRSRKVVRKAIACGWKRDGKAFARPPQQQELALG
jgi:hypothetical protein